MMVTDIIKGVFCRFEDRGVELFVNYAIEPSVYLPSDPHQKDWLVNSERFKDFLNGILLEITTPCNYPNVQEVKCLMSSIREQCRCNERRLSEVEVFETSKNAFVQAAKLALGDSSKVDCLLMEFQDCLLKAQKDGDISRTPKISSEWDCFVAQLRHCSPLLEFHGVNLFLNFKKTLPRCVLHKLKEESLLFDYRGSSKHFSSIY